MKKEFEILAITRKNVLKVIDGLTEAQLTKIPDGFNNNILWNAGHIVSSTQRLTYGISGLPMRITEDYLPFFGKGSNPKQWTSTPDVQKVKTDLIATPGLLEEDYKKGIFKTYKEYETSYGFLITNIEDAITFCNIHEALHLGYIMALKRAL